MSTWVLVLITGVCAVISAAISYGVALGIAKAKINGIEGRLKLMESYKLISREEYESRQRDILDLVKISLRRTISESDS